MSIEQKINYFLNRKAPAVKKIIKRGYQVLMYALSTKIKSSGNIVKISPDEEGEFFFGYYDKSPWDMSGRYVLCMKARKTWDNVAPAEKMDILLLDTFTSSSKVLATTHSWNVQQGCMAQWIGPEFDKEIIYNDFRNGRYCSVIVNVCNGEERELPLPIYALNEQGTYALSLDFSRLHRLRPGYGYSNLDDETKNEKIPKGTCVWKLDLQTGEISEVLTYEQVLRFEPEASMAQSEHKVNHIMINPDGTRFMVMHRWYEGKEKHTRLLTCNVDGSDMFCLNREDVSHCCWKDNNKILAYSQVKGKYGYYLYEDQTNRVKQQWKDLERDGHPSYSPKGDWGITDTYPDRARIAKIYLINDEEYKVLAQVYAPFKYDNETRCDLHPRWSRDGKKICFDSVFEGKRGLYVVEVEG